MRGISLRDYNKGWRTPIGSEDLNDNFGDIREDMDEAFRREQYINNRLNEHISDINYQTQQMVSRISELEDLLVAASGHYADASGNLMYWNGYSNAEVVTNSSRQNLLTGDITLPWSRSWTKLPLVSNEYGDYVTAAGAQIAYDDGTEVYLEIPDDIYDAADNNPETNWVKAYPVANAPTSATVRLELPSSTNPAINSIYVAPFPNGGPVVTNLRYLTSDGSWTQVSNFSSINRRRRFHFSPVDYANQVDVTLTPTTLTDTDGNPVAVFGLQDIDVSLIEYVDSSTFVLKLSAAPGDNINNLTYVYLNYTISPSVIEGNIADADRPVVVEIYENANLSTQIYSNLIYDHPYTGTRPMTPGDAVWVRVTLRRINSTTPVVRELTIKYN